MKKASKTAVTLLLTTLLCANIRANPWYVDASRPDDTGDGLSWGTAKKTIAAGVAEANVAGGVILVADGDYPLTATVTVNNRILRGYNGNREAVVAFGDGTFRCFTLENSGRIENMTITGGHAPGTTDGGGIHVTDSVISNCVVRGNTSARHGGGVYMHYWAVIVDSFVHDNTAATDGGGIYSHTSISGQLLSDNVLINCVVSNNAAATGDGGGVRFSTRPRARIKDSWFIENDANNGGGIAYFGIADITVSNTWIVGNTANVDGGGVWVRSGGGGTASVHLLDCTIVSNQASAGGGVCWYHHFGEALISGGRVEGNSASGGGAYGGGIHVNNVHNTTISNVLVSGNFISGGGSDGGGITVWGGASSTNTTIVNSVITNNSTPRHGGGMYITGGKTRILNNTVVNNTGANRVGGIYLTSTAAGTLIRNCLVADNTSGNYAGGINAESAALIENCTITGNHSANDTGGLRATVASSPVVNTIVYGNTVVNGTTSNWLNTAANAAVYTNSCTAPLTGLPGLNNIDGDPLFINPAEGNYRIKYWRSSCYNKGLNDPSWMDSATDLDGNPRILDGTVEIGAFECVPPPQGMIFGSH